MNSYLAVVIRSFQRWLGLAMKNPRTTAVGIVGVVTGAKLIWSGQLESGLVALLAGLAAVLGADAVTVSRQGDRVGVVEDRKDVQEAQK